MPRKHMNDIERAKSVAWSQEKVSPADIAKRLNVGKRSIGRLIARHKPRPEESVPRRKGLVDQRKSQKVKYRRLKKSNVDKQRNKD
jgi:IS30 family transposase